MGYGRPISRSSPQPYARVSLERFSFQVSHLPRLGFFSILPRVSTYVRIHVHLH